MKKFLLGLLTGIMIVNIPAAFAYIIPTKLFTDVSKTDWYYDYAGNVRTMGIMDGFSDNTFRGNDVVTRAQLAKVISEGLKKAANTYEFDTLTDRVDGLDAKLKSLNFPGDCYYEKKWYKSGDMVTSGLECYWNGKVEAPKPEAAPSI